MKRNMLMMTAAASVILLMTSCGFATIDGTVMVPDGCFEEVVPLEWDGMPSEEELDHKVTFAVCADVHKGREWNDPGVKRCETGFFDFLRTTESSMPIIMLGDISDHGGEKYYRLIDEFYADVHEITHAPIIYTVGNHELMDDDVEHWTAHFTDTSQYTDQTDPYNHYVKTLGCYSYGDILIYNINSGYRIFGRDQLRQIEESLEKHSADYPYRFFLSHVPIASSKVNQSLFWFIMADSDERNEMLRIMETYKPSFRLSGHLHEGKILTEYSPNSKEFIFTAFHSRDIKYDRAGYWHILELDKDTGTITIWNYDMYDEGITMDNYRDEGVYTDKWEFHLGE